MKIAKRVWICVFLIIWLICSAAPGFAKEDNSKLTADGSNLTPETAVDITELELYDRLNKETDVRWYSFSVTVEGDAVVIFDCENGGIKLYSWECSIYDQDKTTLLKSEDVGGGYFYLAANNLTAGTYYIKVQMTQGISPVDSINKYGFCGNEYKLKVITCASSRTGVTGDQILTVTDPGTLLCVVDGAIFLKAHDGEAIVGLCTNEDGRTGPLLVRMDNMKLRNVAYFSSRTGKIHSNDRNPVRYGGYSGKSYDYSSDAGFVEGTFSDTLSPALYHCGEGKAFKMEYAATELLNVHFGEEPTAGLEFDLFWDSPVSYYVVGGIVVVIAIIVIVVYLRGKLGLSGCSSNAGRSTTSYDEPASYTPPKHDGVTWYDGNPWTADCNNAKDM